MNQINEVLEKVQRLHNKDGYFSRFFELCSENPNSTYKSNYHLLEIEYFALFNCFRYSDYQSFKVVKTRYLDKSKKKVNAVNHKNKAKPIYYDHN